MKFTRTQQKMIEILSDGLPHTREELHACLPDELGDISNIRHHVHQIRKVLLPRGETLICELRGYQICYRHVRLLASAVNGYH